MKRLFVNRKEKTNAGDWWSCPKHYFDAYKNDDWVDIYDLEHKDLTIYDEIILGGGGLFVNKVFEKNIQTYLYKQEIINKVIVWSVGVNDYYGKGKKGNNIEVPNLPYAYKTKFNTKKFSIRDQQNDYKIVPCVSCLHPIFNKHFTIKKKYLIIKSPKLDSFEKSQLNYFKGMKIIHQYDNTIEQIVQEIKESEIIYTQSYHAAYWSALCGKKTVIIAPWSIKFLYISFPVKVVGYTKWDEINENELSFDNTYLNVARELNKNFYELINKK
jgi:hypothetical protein